MSHFTVLVIGPDHARALAPFCEAGSGSCEDEFIVDVDETEDARENYEGSTRSMLEKDGERIEAYDNRFYREPTAEETKKHGRMFGSGSGGGISWTSQDWEDGKGYRAKVRYVPEGWTELKVPMPEVMNFAEWCEYYYGWTTVKHGEKPTEEQKHGYVQLGEDGEAVKCIDRTNPNGNWDWFQVGGRWRGYFPLKTGIEYDEAQLGKPGTGEHMDIRDGKGPHANYEAERRVDQVRLGDVDFEHARDKAGREAHHRFAGWKTVFEKHGKPEISWPETYAKIEAEIAELDAKGILEEKVPHPDPNEGHELNRGGLARHTLRQRYNEQPAIAAYREVDAWTNPMDEFGFDEEAYVQKCRGRALVPYALIKDGKWYAKGEMGWWGISTDEKEGDKWSEEVARLYDDLPPDTMLTLVDCHT